MARLSAAAFAGFAAVVLMVRCPAPPECLLDPFAKRNWRLVCRGELGGQVPGISDTAYIANGGTANITTSALNTSAIVVGGAAGGTVNMTSGSSREYRATAGLNGSGTFLQSGGTNSDSNQLYLGYNAGDSGAYSLGGSGTLATYDEYVGYAGAGVFKQTGGTNSTQALSLGGTTSATGTYSMSGNSQLSASLGEYIGYVNGVTITGPALFSQTSGLNTAASMYVGSTGTLQFSGGSLQMNGDLLDQGTFDGASGSGTLAHWR